MIRVILNKSVPGLGDQGEVHDVADGYARNYLVPQGLAMKASPGAEAQAAQTRKTMAQKDARDRDAAEETAKRLAPTIISIAANASEEGRLFGSVGPGEIADAVYAQTGFELDRKSIEIEEPIKDVGLHMVPVALHSNVKIFLQADIQAAAEV